MGDFLIDILSMQFWKKNGDILTLPVIVQIPNSSTILGLRDLVLSKEIIHELNQNIQQYLEAKAESAICQVQLIGKMMLMEFHLLKEPVVKIKAYAINHFFPDFKHEYIVRCTGKLIYGAQMNLQSSPLPSSSTLPSTSSSDIGSVNSSNKDEENYQNWHKWHKMILNDPPKIAKYDDDFALINVHNVNRMLKSFVSDNLKLLHTDKIFIFNRSVDVTMLGNYSPFDSPEIMKQYFEQVINSDKIVESYCPAGTDPQTIDEFFEKKLSYAIKLIILQTYFHRSDKSIDLKDIIEFLIFKKDVA